MKGIPPFKARKPPPMVPQGKGGGHVGDSGSKEGQIQFQDLRFPILGLNIYTVPNIYIYTVPANLAVLKHACLLYTSPSPRD